jgi:hypothetical protein
VTTRSLNSLVGALAIRPSTATTVEIQFSRCGDSSTDSDVLSSVLKERLAGGRSIDPAGGCASSPSCRAVESLP